MAAFVAHVGRWRAVAPPIVRPSRGWTCVMPFAPGGRPGLVSCRCLAVGARSGAPHQHASSRPFSSSSSGSNSQLAKGREQRLAAQTRVQREQLLRFKPVAPFREARQSTAGTAQVMALLMRPTSPSLVRLALALLASSCCVATIHWVLFPNDPFFVLSGSCGAFLYVAVVGTSHSPIWYAASVPAVAFGLQFWPSYARSLQPPEGLVRRRR